MDLKDYLTIKPNNESVTVCIEDTYHDNWGLQWNRFNKLQLDSFNGATESCNRLLNESELQPEDFNGKTILEVGAGNGRFTEILLQFGARVIALDYSTAIYANQKNHEEFVKNGKLLCLRGDLFELPIKTQSFDIVICYGVIQHTGNNERCLDTLACYVKPDGLLLVDIYSNSLRHYNPWVYFIRPFFSKFSTLEKRMEFVERFVNRIFPYQLKILGFLHNRSGIFKYLKYIVNRSPNSVYGINLFLEGKISIENAKDWSICDTYDAWTPNHDHPVSRRRWKKLLSKLAESQSMRVKLEKECGQGNCAVLEKIEA